MSINDQSLSLIQSHPISFLFGKMSGQTTFLSAVAVLKAMTTSVADPLAMAVSIAIGTLTSYVAQ